MGFKGALAFCGASEFLFVVVSAVGDAEDFFRGICAVDERSVEVKDLSEAFELELVEPSSGGVCELHGFSAVEKFSFEDSLEDLEFEACGAIAVTEEEVHAA